MPSCAHTHTCKTTLRLPCVPAVVVVFVGKGRPGSYCMRVAFVCVSGVLSSYITADRKYVVYKHLYTHTYIYIYIYIYTQLHTHLYTLRPTRYTPTQRQIPPPPPPWIWHSGRDRISLGNTSWPALSEVLSALLFKVFQRIFLGVGGGKDEGVRPRLQGKMTSSTVFRYSDMDLDQDLASSHFDR